MKDWNVAQSSCIDHIYELALAECGDDEARICADKLIAIINRPCEVLSDG